MPPVIRISDESWERLKQWAIPLEDTPDKVLVRLFDMADEHRSCATFCKSGHNGDDDTREELFNPEQMLIRDPDPGMGSSPDETSLDGLKTVVGETDRTPSPKRLPKGQQVPRQQFERPILEALYELGGKANNKVVLKEVYERTKHLLHDVDHLPISSDKTPRWRRSAQWVRQNLVKKGLVKDKSEWGVWELTDLGIAEVEKSKG